jgi:hypothetical protein
MLIVVPMYYYSLRDVRIFPMILVNCALFTNFYAYFYLEMDCRFFSAATATL